MNLFEVYTQKVKLNAPSGEIELTILPLNGAYLPKVYLLLKKFNLLAVEVPSDASAEQKHELEKEASKKFFETMDEETIRILHEVCTQSLVSSYPTASKTDIELFVSQNLMALFPVVIQVNMNNRP